MAAVDSTLDWQNADFSGADGKTRICYLDQETAGDSIECSKSDIDDGSCKATQGGGSDGVGHGTHVTGIAAGSNATYTGVAPESFIAFAFLRNTDTDSSGTFSTAVLDGVTAIFAKADTFKMPAVINISLGTSLGAHDDTSLLEQGLDSAATGHGRVIVNAAGNEK